MRGVDTCSHASAPIGGTPIVPFREDVWRNVRCAMLWLAALDDSTPQAVAPLALALDGGATNSLQSWLPYHGLDRVVEDERHRSNRRCSLGKKESLGGSFLWRTSEARSTLKEFFDQKCFQFLKTCYGRQSGATTATTMVHAVRAHGVVCYRGDRRAHHAQVMAGTPARSQRQAAAVSARCWRRAS